jgi:arylsulfatase A-like enzyme
MMKQHSMSRIGLILLGFTANEAYSAEMFDSETSNTPNVVIVVTDDQGKGDLGCLGSAIIQTPHLDRFYEDAVSLTNFQVSPTSAPTRAGLMTGRCTNRTNCFHMVAGRSWLFKDEKILAQGFATNGYATGMFGKWHLGNNYPFRPEDRGFQEVVRHGGGGVTQAPDYRENTYCFGFTRIFNFNILSIYGPKEVSKINSNFTVSQCYSLLDYTIKCHETG